MASVLSWFKRHWPAPDDLLLVDIRGEEKKLRAFMRLHPLETGLMHRKGSQVSFRAYVAAHLRGELEGAAESSTVVLNASNDQQRSHPVLILSTAPNRFLDGTVPAGIGLPSSRHDTLDYWSIDEVDSALINLETKFAGRAVRKKLQLPSAGSSRDCWALRILGPAAPGKKVLVLIGGIHGDEWGSCESIIQFATDLLTATAVPGSQPLTYGSRTFTGAEVDSILGKMDIVLFPLVNPDGRAFSQSSGTLWRKNRSEACSDGVAAKIGVDINRNFAFLSEYETAFVPSFFGPALRNALEPTYCGPKAFSENESLNVRWLLDEFPETAWLLDLHSAWGSVLHPWSDDEIQTDDSQMNFLDSAFDGQRGEKGDRTRAGDSGYREYMPPNDQAEFTRLAGLLTSAMNSISTGGTYKQFPFYAYGTFFGTCIDYAYARQFMNPPKPPIHALHIEWGDNVQKNPPWARMQNKFMPEVIAGLVGFCVAA